MYNEKIFDVVTGKEVYRDYTSVEIAEVEEIQSEIAKRLAKANEAAAAKAALLEKLGITEEEAKLLLGGN